MQTNRRGFLGLIGAAIGALTLPRQAPATPGALPQPAGAAPAREPLQVPRRDYWQPAHDFYEIRDRDNNPQEIISYNAHEEFHGPAELLNIGGQYDGPIIIKSRTVHQHHGDPWPRVTIRATRYPKIL